MVDAPFAARVSLWPDIRVGMSATGGQGPLTTEDFELDLRRAIAAGEIEPWFQPTVSSRTGHVECLEALARWRHPVRGLLPPDDFLPQAEAAGLISLVDEAMLAAACRWAAPWIAEGLVDGLACNVSAHTLAEPGFPSRVLAQLDESGLAPEALTIEITETAVVKDAVLARHQIARLAARRVRFALDDFGVGYSNLHTLMHLPVQVLKLDRSLVSEIGESPWAANLVRSLLQVARSMRLTVVAEGVEDAAQAAFLKRAGCARMQGYLFARPMGAEQIELMLRRAGKGRARLRGDRENLPPRAPRRPAPDVEVAGATHGAATATHYAILAAALAMLLTYGATALGQLARHDMAPPSFTQSAP